MSSVQEIEEAIRGLPPTEQDGLFFWIEEQYAQAFDKRLDREVQNGALDKLVDQALSDFQAGRVRDL